MGSLTQWLFSPDACDCDFLKLTQDNKPDEEAEQEQLCLNCGKRIASGRMGSLTQWVFRAETCSCQKEKFTPAPGEEFVPRIEPAFDETPSYEEPDSELTARLGLPERYSAIRMLGSGSLSKVYKCWDNMLSMPVAVKHLSSINLSAVEVVQFQEEAKATSTLSHPAIVRVLDFGATASAQPYMVMEYIDGKSVESLIQEHGPMPARVVARLMISVCAGMQHAHNNGIFHRDLKSSNLVIPLTGKDLVPVAKVIDFGIAAINRTGSEEITYQGHKIAGTPGYMSPDQLRGETYDERSDIYSLGCTMFEALTGRLPFIGRTSLQLLNQHASSVPPTLSQANAEIRYSDMLEGIVARALAKTKEERFQTMLEMSEALEGFLEEEQASTLYMKEEPAAPRRKGIALAAMIALVLAGATVAGGIMTGNRVIGEGKQAPIPQVSSEKPYVPQNLDDTISPIATHAFGLEGVTKKDQDLKLLDPKTKKLDLVGSDVTNDGIDYITDLPLESLRLDATKLTDEGIAKLAKIKTLRVLYIGDNPLLTAGGIKPLEALPNLRVLSVNAAPIGDEDLKALENFKALVFIDLGGTRVQGDGFVYLKQLPNLRSLYLTGLKLSKKGVKNLAELSNLEELEARGVEASDDLIEALLQMKNLHYLNLSETELANDQLAKLSRLKHLTTLRIERCPQLSTASLTRIAAQLPHCRVLDGRKREF